MHVDIARHVPRVAPERALAWWTDFQDGRADHGFLPRVERRVHERDAAHARMSDRFRILGLELFREDVRAWRDGSVVRFEGANNFAEFTGAYSFEPADGPGGSGTRIRLEADIELKKTLRPLAVPAKPLVRAILVADLRGHAREMARDLRA